MQTQDYYSYGDLRIAQRAKNFYKSIVEKNSVCIRSIAGCRKQEVAFHRLIKNPKFSTIKMITEARSHSQEVTKNSEHVLCIQDTSELYFDEIYRRVRKDLGPLTHSFCKGIFFTSWTPGRCE